MDGFEEIKDAYLKGYYDRDQGRQIAKNMKPKDVRKLEKNYKKISFKNKKAFLELERRHNIKQKEIERLKKKFQEIMDCCSIAGAKIIAEQVLKET